MSFDTPLSLAGPLRKPLQMLADQEYGGHSSIHDDAMAEKLGFRSGPARLRGVSKLMGASSLCRRRRRRAAPYRATPRSLKQAFEWRP